MAFKSDEHEKAFQRYCADPAIQEALRIDRERGKTLTEDLLRDCFTAGAKWMSDLYVAQRKAKGGSHG